jgi:hypothetical protein
VHGEIRLTVTVEIQFPHAEARFDPRFEDAGHNLVAVHGETARESDLYRN